MPARYLLRLPELALARRHIKVKSLLRRRRRFVGISQRIRIELVTGRQAKIVGLLVEFDFIGFFTFVVRYDDARQRVLALVKDDPVGKGNETADVHARAMFEPVFPVFAPRCFNGRTCNLEVDGIICVGLDIEVVAVMLDVIQLLFDPGSNQPGRGAGRGIGPKITILARRALARADEYVLTALAPACKQEHRIVGLLVDEQVIGRVRTENVLLDALRALVFVALDVIERLRIGSPHR